MDENMLAIRFERRKIGEIEDVVFKGIRATEDVAFKVAFILGELCGLDACWLEFEDEDGVSGQLLRFDDVKYAAELEQEELENSEVEE